MVWPVMAGKGIFAGLLIVVAAYLVALTVAGFYPHPVHY